MGSFNPTEPTLEEYNAAVERAKIHGPQKFRGKAERIAMEEAFARKILPLRGDDGKQSTAADTGLGQT